MSEKKESVEFDYSKKPVVLSATHVSKSFKLPTEQATGLKQAVINWTKGIKGYKKQTVLKDVSFEVHQGEFFGIVGRNGGGKSTLLKLISQIYYPDEGEIHFQGKLVPFIELGVGFNPELTGRENVYLNGALLGFTREQVDAMYDDIVEFAELDEFMDQKLKNYSSGMQVRLAFSVAIKAQGDILVLDEVLAVGDEAFQRYCIRAMFIQDGVVAAIGDRETVAEKYTLANLEAEEKKQEKRKKVIAENKDEYPNGLNARCPLLRTYGVSPLILKSSDMFKFAVEYQYDEPGDFYLAIALHDVRRGGITYDTGAKTIKMEKHGHQTVYFEMPLNLFNDGEFRLITSLRTPTPGDDAMTDAVAVALDENACTFVIRDARNRNYALLSDRAMTIAQIDESER